MEKTVSLCTSIISTQTGPCHPARQDVLGVEVSGQDIYVTCHRCPDDSEVRVLDKQGNLKRRLGIRGNGTYLFLCPCYITVSTAGDKLIVSDCDWWRLTVTCMGVDGNIIYQYKYTDLNSPMGLYCDDRDNAMVCGYFSNKIDVITSDGKKHGTLLSSQDGLLKNSESVVYRKTDDTLVVGSWNNNHFCLSIIKLM